MRPDRFRLVGWLASGVCLAASAGLMLSRHAGLIAAGREESRAGTDLQTAREAAAAVTRKPSDGRFTCAPRAQNEETAFLLDLRKRAHLCGVSITRWSSHPKDYHKEDSVAATEATKALEGVTKVQCDLALTGPYPALRAFLAEVWGSDRLLTISHVDWTRTDQSSELSLSLGRYLVPKPGATKS